MNSFLCFIPHIFAGIKRGSGVGTYTGFLGDYVPRLLFLGAYVNFVGNYVP